MPTPRTKRAEASPNDGAEVQFCAQDSAAEAHIQTIAFGKEDKNSQNLVFQKCRRWRRHWFISAILLLRQSFFNHGFALKAVKPGDRETLKKWKEGPAGVLVMDQVSEYLDDLWGEWLLLDNAISFWRKSSERPVILNPETCDYTDTFGSEVLKIKHRLTREQIDRLVGWSDEEKARLKKGPELIIGPDDGLFFFKVSKRSKMGSGLAWPSFTGVMEALGQGESLEVGDAILAAAGRLVIEHWKFGHEITSGALAGQNKHFWKKPEADSFLRNVKGKTGHLRITTNFDKSVEFPRPDPKNFDADRYKSVIERLLWWSQPLGQMVTASGVTPYLMTLLRQQAELDRAKLQRHLNHVLGTAFQIPVAVTVSWGNRCFRDERIASELFKLAFTGGPLSQETLLEELDLEPESERTRKEAEAKLPKSQTTPIYDPAHGDPAAAAPGGRPPGTPDPKA